MSTSKASSAHRPRKLWEKPSIRPVGTIPEVLQGGNGKQSVASADSGDSRKPNGQG